MPRSARLAMVAIGLALALGACGSASTPGATSAATDEPEQTEFVEPSGPDVTEPPEATQDISGEPDPGSGRPTTVKVTVSGTSGGQADGTFEAAATARFCGPFVLAPEGFLYGFPKDGVYNPGDVSFSAEQLLSGASTSTFLLSVSVVPPNGGNQPVIAINPGSVTGDSGTATRSDAGGTTTLIIDASNDVDVHLKITATCGPRP